MTEDLLAASVVACLGEAEAKYLANKARGGSNGRKGTRYEDFFAAFKVAEACVARLRENRDWPRIQEQVRAFVDDLRLSTPHTTEYFQLKNVQGLAWHSSEHPLVDDFRYQKVLSDHLGETSPKTTLVVSTEVVFQAMESLPDAVLSHSSVVHFPYADGHANRLIQESAPLREMLKVLSRSSNMPMDSLEGVFGVLIIGVMQQNGNEVSIEEVLASARKVSPGLIRRFPNELQDVVLDPNFEAVLARISGFVYVTERGFFEWSYYDTSGVTPYDCLSEEFGRLQKRIVSHSPTTFEELEELL